MRSFRRNEVLVLLGAGASVKAGVPHAAAMIKEIETLVESGARDWSEFRELYRYVRSAVQYAEGLKARSEGRLVFNIERLVGALEEIHKKEMHPLYPFVGAWNPKLLEVAGHDFDAIRRFRAQIMKKLREEWVPLERNEDASYYSGLERFQREYQHPLRVFSLNYDRCVEVTCGRARLECGFDGRTWDWRRFEDNPDDPKDIYLYKLHGSIDWRRAGGELTSVDNPLAIGDDDVAMIFATAYKLQYVDPFLFFAYELRRWSLDEAAVIVAIGYGFGDEHINGILGQALKRSPGRRIVCVGPVSGEEEVQKEGIRTTLGAQAEQVVVVNETAESYLPEKLTVESLSSYLPEEQDPFA